MPKKLTEITKSRRMKAIKEVLKTWGVQDIKEIIQKLSNKLDEDINLIKRTIYRDLDELVAEHLLIELYYTRSGEMIDDYDPELNKSATKKWQITDLEGQVHGDLKFINSGGELYCDPLIRDDVTFFSGSREPDHHNRYIYFAIGTTFFSLALNKMALPITVIFSRKKDEINYTEVNNIKDNISKRVIILKLPIASLSTYKGEKKLGHARLTITPDGKVEAEDLGSSNGSYYAIISPREAQALLDRGISQDCETVSSSLNSKYFPDIKFEKLLSIVKSDVSIVLKLSDHFKVIVL